MGCGMRQLGSMHRIDLQCWGCFGASSAGRLVKVRRQGDCFISQAPMSFRNVELRHCCAAANFFIVENTFLHRKINNVTC